jgi:CBS domain-containing protein
MSAREILRKKSGRVVTVEPNMPLSHAARLLMRHGIGGLPVVDRGGALIGFLSERDIVNAVDGHPGSIQDVPVDEAMRRPPPTCAPDDPLHAVMARMTRDRLRHLVAVDGGGIAGVISVGDLVKHRLEQLETETGVLRDILAAQRASR